MALSVNDAFEEFLMNSVNLDNSVSDEAKENRAELVSALDLENDDGCFKPYKDINFFFGSFSRKTKCRPLDDLDIMFGLSAEGNTYSAYSWDNILINPSAESPAQQECKDKCGKLDSNMVLGKVKKKLKEICDLRVNDVIKNGEAITVNYKSKDWSFDIVPCFFTKPESDERTYYLIPNGAGAWKKTDTRIDNKRVKALVEKNGTIILDAIRLFKYWNKNAKVVTLDGYVAESLLLDYYESSNEKCTKFVDVEFIRLLAYVRDNIVKDIYDPKKIQGNINNLDYWQRQSVKQKVETIYGKAIDAFNAETKEKNGRKSINIWRDIFGGEFPTYE